MSELTASMRSCQPPPAPGSASRRPTRPSLPTCSAVWTNSCVIASFSSTTSLNAWAISPSMPVRLSGMRTEKSPRLNARRALSSSPRSRTMCKPGWMDSI